MEDPRPALERKRSEVARLITDVSFVEAARPPTPPAQAPACLPLGEPTAALLDAVVEAGYSGPAWEELERRLVERALLDLAESIQKGTIFQRCARAGVPIKKRPELRRHPYPEDIAAEAVEECLHRFRTRVLPAGEWDPAHGTSLEDFFAACCLSDVANRWRWHLRRLPEAAVSLDVSAEDQVVILPVDPMPGPEAMVEQRELVAAALAPMDPADRVTFVMLADGWKPDEIARALGTTRGALYVRVSRARTAARQRRTGS